MSVAQDKHNANGGSSGAKSTAQWAHLSLYIGGFPSYLQTLAYSHI